jgi:hypothetical protein
MSAPATSPDLLPLVQAPLFHNAWWAVDDLGEQALLVTRSSLAFSSAAQVAEATTPMLETLDARGRASLAALVDSRYAPARNDPEYESWFAPYSRLVLADFTRVAILMKTAVGMLQARRLAAEPERRVYAVNSLDAALRWVRDGVPPSSSHLPSSRS